MRILLVSMLVGLAAAQGTWIKGKATFTGLPQNVDPMEFNAAAVKEIPNGACGYGPMTAAQYPFFLVAGVGASNPISKGAQRGCGTCLEVKCADSQKCDNSKPLIVTVTDSCDECAANQLNLQATAFSQFASLSTGNVEIEYRQVACGGIGNIALYVDEFRSTQGGFLKLALRNVNGPAGIASVAFRTTGSSNNWRKMENKFGAVWEASSLTAFPLDLQVTRTDGKSLVLAGVITKTTAPGVVSTNYNFLKSRKMY